MAGFFESGRLDSLPDAVSRGVIVEGSCEPLGGQEVVGGGGAGATAVTAFTRDGEGGGDPLPASLPLLPLTPPPRPLMLDIGV